MCSKSSSDGVGGGGGTADGGSGVAEGGGVSALADSRSSVSGVSGRPWKGRSGSIEWQQNKRSIGEAEERKAKR